MINVTSDLTLAFEEVTEEIEQIIGEEVHNLFRGLKQAGRDVHDTWHFMRSIKAPVKNGYNWKIELKAKYSSILWRGRHKVGNKEYGSLKWYNGGQPMIYKMEREIERRTNDIQK